MKIILLAFFLTAVGFITINAQIADTPAADTLVVFESQADTTGWELFANGTSPADDDVIVVTNPDATGLNPTDSVLQFTVNADADPWASIVNNVRFGGDSAITITQENHIMTMMVYKSKISNVGLKLEGEINLGLDLEILVPNTLIDEWEVLTFDFSDAIGSTYEALAIYPDFSEDREEGTVVYLDNIVFGEEVSTSARLPEELGLKVYPNPVLDKLYVQHPGITGYSISNSLGQLVEKSVFGATNFKTIEVSKLKSGIHFITVQSKDGIQTTRFIKK